MNYWILYNKLNNMHLKNIRGEFTFNANFEGEMCENVNVKKKKLRSVYLHYKCK